MKSLSELGTSIEKLLSGEYEVHRVGDEIFISSGDLHVKVAKEKHESYRVPGRRAEKHWVEGHYKSSLRQSRHWVEGYWRSGAWISAYTRDNTTHAIYDELVGFVGEQKRDVYGWISSYRADRIIEGVKALQQETENEF